MKLLLLLILIAFAGCIHRESSSPENNSYSKFLTEKEANQLNKSIDTLGVIISTIDFAVKATEEDLDIFENGIVPWISIEEPDKEIGRLIKADEIVLPFAAVTLIIDYPLENPATFALRTTGSGFSRKQLIREISKKYHEIYKEEEATATIKTVPIEKRERLMNRNQTNGKYGVWGHDLSDLDLSSVEVYKKADGKIYLILIVES